MAKNQLAEMTCVFDFLATGFDPVKLVLPILASRRSGSVKVV
jgi:hypothetical protein